MMDKEDVVYVYNGIFLSLRNDKYPPFASTWMEMEGIMLSEISQSEKDKPPIGSHSFEIGRAHV